MSLRLSLVSGCAAVLLLGGAGPVAPQTREGWLADYRTLKSELESQYANLTWFASPEGGRDLPALDRNTTAALERATTEDEARTALLAFQAAFKDGHFVGRPALAPASGESPEPDWPDLKAADEAARACLALGYGGATAAFSLPIETLPGFVLETDGDGQAFRSGIVTTGAKRIGVVRIAAALGAADLGFGVVDALCSSSGGSHAWIPHGFGQQVEWRNATGFWKSGPKRLG